MKIIGSRSAKQSCSWFFYHLPHNKKLPTSSDSVSRCFSFCIVNPVLVRTHSNSLSTASSRLDRLWYHRETTACSSNDKRWLEKKHWYCHHTASEIFQLQTWLWFGHKLKEKVSGNICYSLTGTQHLSAPPPASPPLPGVGRAQSIQEVFTQCCPDTSHRLLQQCANERSSLRTSDQGNTSLWCGQKAVTWTPANNQIDKICIIWKFLSIHSFLPGP